MKDVIELIQDNVINFPNRIAVIDRENQINYADFLHLVDSISYYLLQIGQRPKVVIDLQQGVYAYALIVAVLNVGGTYCPLNSEAPFERKKQIIDEFVPDLIIVENDVQVSEFSVSQVVPIGKLLHKEIFTKIKKDYDGEDIIYIIYTSGSTGMPKGVQICRKALNKFLEWSIPTYAASKGDIWGQFSLLSFDLSIVDIFTCLCSGATLFAMNDSNAKKYRPSTIIENHKITIWHSIPSAVEFMMKNEKTKKYNFSSLRLISFCGEALKKHQVDFLFEKKDDLIIFNTYGPTEGTLFCTWQELKKGTYLDFCDTTMSIGKAIPGWNLHLESIEGFEGSEVIIHGDYIGKGYLGNIAGSKFKQFKIADANVSSFETGDIVNDKNGKLYFSCRKDRQVKIKGFRIELDEIDFRINEFLKKTSVTVVRENSLYSFIESVQEIDKAELCKFLKSKLEAYKIPNDFYVIHEIPRGQNQKVDNNALLKLIP